MSGGEGGDPCTRVAPGSPKGQRLSRFLKFEVEPVPDLD